MQSKYALDLQQLTAKPSRRLINQALKDQQALNSTFIGQDRARDALSFGLGIEARGYNLYIMGEQATGRFTLVHEFIDKYVNKTVTCASNTSTTTLTKGRASTISLLALRM